MRTIKFRAWEIDTQKWLYFTIDRFPSNPQTIKIPTQVKIFLNTGLLDKNGKKIYEGDILMMDSWNPSNYQIKFMEGAFCLAFYGGKFDGEYAGDIHYIHHAEIPQATVKGNIYENPELLAQ